MKNTLLISLLLVCIVLAEGNRHRLKKSMKAGIKIKKASLKVKKSTMKMKKMQIKIKAKTMAKIKQLGGMEDEKTQRVFRDKDGNCIWGDLKRRTSQYPTIIKDHYRPEGDKCVTDANGNASCRMVEETLDLAAKEACKQPFQANSEAIYYVNTRRQQPSDTFGVNDGFLSQFTFVVLPSSKEAITDDYEPKLFSVIVPLKKSIEPYVLDKCPFDFSMGKQKDLEDNSKGDCYYNIAKGTKVVMKFHESEDFKKYEKEKENMERSGYSV